MKNTIDKLELAVTDELTVTVLPNSDHEFLMTTKEVSQGYDISEYAIRKTLLRHGEELVDGKHYVTAGTICPGDHQRVMHLPHNAILWTKKGVVRLGFFIKSEQAKLFRDWAEDLILMVDKHMSSPHNFANSKALPAKRRNNRLTPTRLVGLLVEASKIDNNELRNSIVSKLMEGEALD